MGCFGLYRKKSAGEAAAATATVQTEAQHYAVPAMIDGAEGVAVVDEADRHTSFEYNRAAPPGQRLTRKEATPCADSSQ